MEEEKKETEEVKEETKKENFLTKKKQVKGKSLRIWIIVMIIIFMLFTFGLGMYLGKEMARGEIDNNNDKPKEQEKKDNQPKEAIPEMDRIAINLYGGGYVYFINNDTLYYLKASEIEPGRWFILTHSGCLKDNSDPYCQGNPEYSNKAVKVEGLGKVSRVKIFNKVGASDESFTAYAITEDGNIYSLNGNNATKFLGENDIEDMLGQKDGSQYEILLKNGKHMIYEWHIKEGTDFEIETSYTEKE